MERGTSKKVKSMRTRPRWVTCLQPRAMVLYEPKLLPRPLSGSTALLQPQSVLVLVIPFNNEGQEERTAELAPSLSGYNSTEHWPYPSQTIITNSIGENTGELDIRA